MQRMSRPGRICFITSIVLLFIAGGDFVGDFTSAAMSDGSAATEFCGGPGDECYCCCGHYEVPMPPVVLPEQLIELYESSQSIPPVSVQRAPLYRPPRA
jgi:hypothetical protein